MTALHRAVRYGHPRAVSLLVNRSAQISILDDAGTTPTDLASECCEYEICKSSADGATDQQVN